MQTRFGHIEFKVRATNLPFYRDLFTFLGWKVLMDGDGVLGFGDPSDGSFWFVAEVKNVANDYDGPGVNHVAVGAPSITDVDATTAYLRDHGVATLFETPRHRPEFSGGDNTYYQVMFESPDRVLFEVVYTGPKG